MPSLGVFFCVFFLPSKYFVAIPLDFYDKDTKHIDFLAAGIKGNLWAALGKSSQFKLVNCCIPIHPK